jgi:hypothetical protein
MAFCIEKLKWGENVFHPSDKSRGVRRGVSKGLEDRPPCRLFRGWPPAGRKGLGMAGPNNTLGSLWSPLEICPQIREPFTNHERKNFYIAETHVKLPLILI